jgi:hypothetical protein
LRAKGVAHLCAVESDPGDTALEVVVVRDVGQLLEALDLSPQCRIEQLGYRFGHALSLATGPSPPPWRLSATPRADFGGVSHRQPFAPKSARKRSRLGAQVGREAA